MPDIHTEPGQHDLRNVTDEFKGMSEETITKILDERGVGFEVAIENTLRDFNMGSIVRTANAFGIRTVHVIGRRQWNKRGAMMTDKYLHIHYHESQEDFIDIMKKAGRRVVAIDNVEGSKDITLITPRRTDVLVFGQEGPGISNSLLASANEIGMITQHGSTRSLNVSVAAGIAMHYWVSHF